MWIVIPLAVGSVLLVVAGFTWAARREVLERARAVRRLAPIPLDEVKAAELVAVRAKAAASEPLTDPVIGEGVAFYEARVTKNGAELRSVREGDTIVLEDASGRAEVRLAGAELDLAWDDTVESEELTPSMRALLKTIPEPEKGAGYALAHRAIRIGQELTVVGVPRFDEKASTRSGYRGGAGALPRFDPANGVLIVATAELAEIQRREQGDTKAMSAMLRFATAIGVVLVGIGALLLALA